MSRSRTSVSHLDVAQTVWDELTVDDRERVQQEVLRWIDQWCKEQINAGNYDSAVSLEDLFEEFERSFVGGSHDVSVTYAFPGDVSNDIAARLLFQRVIDELESRDVLLYVYDKQRVRSRVAEVTRYFALLRQRFADESEFEFAPSLTKMVKMDIQSREKPKWGDEGVKLDQRIRKLLAEIRTLDPAPELIDGNTPGDWQTATKDALKLLLTFCKEEQLTGLAHFQARSLQRLFLQAVSTEHSDQSHVITASTGGGKTEAFLFPILAYTFTTAHESLNVDGVDAVLAYPRTDLCNNQFERIVQYLYVFEQLLEGQSAHEADYPADELPVTVALQHGSASNVTIDCPDPACDGQMSTEEFVCDGEHNHEISFAKASKGASADIIVVTPDTLHRRLMDHRGHNQFWRHGTPPKFVVLDEVHVYTNQYGMHVANVIRRFKAAMRSLAPDQDPMLVASSATISNATNFTAKIFGTEEAKLTTPREENGEIEEIGWEYLVFVKATDPREVKVPQGEAKYKPRNEWEEDEYDETNVTNLSSMIQVSFAMYHTILKQQPADGPMKNKILGFVDSIDSVKRLGDYIQDAESDRGAEGQELFTLRTPDAILHGPDEEGTNPDCPKSTFQNNAASHERAVCEPLPPNKQLNPCPVYEAGECWWTMQDQLDLESMDVYLHKSGRTERPNGTIVKDDQWDLMVTTSALEVGFDHPGIIGTFQYRAPMNIPGFVQRKGRGGRDPDDQPISVVVLGSRPEDAFYFHHEELLSDPDDRYLRIALDEENEFVRIEHMISAIFDYFNLTDNDSADQIYRRLDIKELSNRLKNEREAIEDWLNTAFPKVEDELVNEVIDKITQYVESTKLPIAGSELPGEMQAFWEAARIPQGMSESELESRVKDLEYKRNLFQDIIEGEIELQTDE